MTLEENRPGRCAPGRGAGLTPGVRKPRAARTHPGWLEPGSAVGGQRAGTAQLSGRGGTAGLSSRPPQRHAACAGLGNLRLGAPDDGRSVPVRCSPVRAGGERVLQPAPQRGLPEPAPVLALEPAQRPQGAVHVRGRRRRHLLARRSWHGAERRGESFKGTQVKPQLRHGPPRSFRRTTRVTSKDTWRTRASAEAAGGAAGPARWPTPRATLSPSGAVTPGRAVRGRPWRGSETARDADTGQQTVV